MRDDALLFCSCLKWPLRGSLAPRLAYRIESHAHADSVRLTSNPSKELPMPTPQISQRLARICLTTTCTALAVTTAILIRAGFVLFDSGTQYGLLEIARLMWLSALFAIPILYIRHRITPHHDANSTLFLIAFTAAGLASFGYFLLAP